MAPVAMVREARAIPCAHTHTHTHRHTYTHTHTHTVYTHIQNLVLKRLENIHLEDQEKEWRKQEDVSQGAVV